MINTEGTKVWAHRGASGYAPENTLEAFKKAEKMKADGVELDVQLTKDGELVVIHDETVDRVSGEKGFVKDYTLKELKRLNVSKHMPSYDKKTRIPTLDEVFDLLLHKDLLYPCYCSRSERLAASAPHPGEHRSDSGCKCRHLSLAARRELEAAGRKAAWKIKVPDKTISFCDGHYGKFSENLADGGDFIIKRSDGVYAYQLAVSFDDIDIGSLGDIVNTEEKKAENAAESDPTYNTNTRVVYLNESADDGIKRNTDLEVSSVFTPDE